MKEKIGQKTVMGTKTIEMVQVALLAALTYLATAAIAIPVGDNAVLHVGDAIVYISAILLGKKKGAIAAAIGMTCFDLFSPYYIWAPFTFVIKGMMAYITGAIAYRGEFEGENILNNIFAFTVAGIAMVIGYFIAGGCLNHFVYGIVTLKGGLIVAIKDIPANLLQVAFGMAIAIPLSTPLKKHLKKYL